MIYCFNVPGALQIFGQWLYNWQTLLGAALASIAAFVTVQKLREQIRQSDNHRSDEIKRRHTSARVALPFTLAALSDYCRQIAGNIADAVDQIDNGNWAIILRGEYSGTIPLEEIDFPIEVIPGISLFSETLRDPLDIKHMAELSARVQIMTSRYESFDKKRADAKQWLYTILIDCGIVSYLCNSIYNYARFAQDDGFSVVGVTDTKKSWDEVQNAITGLLFERPLLDRYVKETWGQITQYIENDTLPWIAKFER